MFSLDDQLMATMIAEKCKGDFDSYLFVINNFNKHANAKGVSSWVVAFGELLGTMEAAHRIYAAR
jgi:hypothetical protein